MVAKRGQRSVSVKVNGFHYKSHFLLPALEPVSNLCRDWLRSSWTLFTIPLMNKAAMHQKEKHVQDINFSQIELC